MANVLIVDDDAALREGLAETVADLGHAPRTAASGRKAMEALAADDIDCVLLDLRMPGGMDGIEVLKRIRERENAPAAIVLTAFATAENTIEAMATADRTGAFRDAQDGTLFLDEIGDMPSLRRQSCSRLRSARQRARRKQNRYLSFSSALSSPMRPASSCLSPIPRTSSCSARTCRNSWTGSSISFCHPSSP